MSSFHEILAEESRYWCEQRTRQQHTMEIVCVSLSSKSMEELGDDACEYSDATSVSSVTLASSFDDDDDDDIVTIHRDATPFRWKQQRGAVFDNKTSSIFRESLTRNGVSEPSQRKLDECSATWWNDQGDKYKETESYQKAMEAYQKALNYGVGLELARAYTGLGSVHIELGDVRSALQCRNYAQVALAEADASASSALSFIRDEISWRSVAEDELNELFCKVTELE